MGNKKLSIITVCLNSKNYLEQTIKSLIKVGLDNCEYIIIDGQSTDGTLDVIEQYKKHITYWVSEPDNGIYDAMNKGLRVASGEWVLFLNSGDILYDRCFDLLEVEGNADVVFGNANIIDDGNVIGQRMAQPLDDIWKGMPFCHQAAFTKRTSFYEIGFFDISYNISADYKWFLAAYDEGMKFKYIDRIIAGFLDGGISSRYYEERFWESIRASFDVVNKNADEKIIEKVKRDKRIDCCLHMIMNASNRQEDINEYLKAKLEFNRISIWGAGIWGSRLCSIISACCGIDHVVDSDITKNKIKICNICIEEPAVLVGYSGLVIVAIRNVDNKIIEEIKKILGPNAHIITLVQLATDVFGNQVDALFRKRYVVSE
ncbi:Glycosyltransferase involved in cell wall bisynthesis [Butyrivibrio sp. INlla18]|uniref:glycosyltransferase family 2 protein n=1 Tax=Butyrivibrio sp. INlla18 TaxID=1520806 RepID=UPI00088A70BC|nr:glycosyltransferase family 2 protein [Butyrivibrio sp. INlla18]SDA41639.1 Glycosyltransferase involved in cell wall bisynthesis [Butyrivibrio sp. INlla18]